MTRLALPRPALRFFTGFTRAEWLFSAKSFGAAMLAMYIASRAGLPRPFWAMLTAYIVSHPLAGNVRSKALYRFCGTLLGCTATLVMVPALSNAPPLLALVLALWVGGCLFLSLQDRTARSYVFMLAGYTAALIGFPSVETPLLLFDTAVARVEEIGLGILCATLVHSIVLPTGLAPTLLGVLDRALGDARRWGADLLARGRGPAGGEAGARTLAADRQRLAGDITQLRLLSTHVPFDTGNLRWTAGALGAMQDRLAALTPTLSAVEDRLQALEETEGLLAPDVLAVLAATARCLHDGPQDPAQDPARAALRQALPALGMEVGMEVPLAPWNRALRIGLAGRLEELVAGWDACAQLRGDIDAGLAGRAPLRRAASLGRRALHRDVGMALLSALAAVLAICLCCAFWIGTAWPGGSVATMMAAVFCSFFATLDDPVPAIHGFLTATLWSVPLSAFYVLVAMPAVHDFGMLALVCAPVFLVLGCYAGRPTTTPTALAMIMGVAGTLALHDTATANLTSFINSTLAQLLGIAAAAQVTRLVRSVGADWSMRRIQRATRRDLAALAAGPGGDAPGDAYAARMLDRIALLAPRIAQAGITDEAAVARDALRDLRMGTDIAALQRLRPLWPGAGAAALLAGMAGVFRQRAAHAATGSAPAGSELLGQIDRLLAAALQRSQATGAAATPGAELRAAVTALVGLRRNLFPGAPALAPSSDGAPTP
ncbi:MAG: FUSC family protein [Pseudomonadota bacterium]